MRSVGISAVVVLVVLQAVRISGAPIDTIVETTTETTIDTTTGPITTACPTISCDDPNCFVDKGPDGCPTQCVCGDPICMLVSCGPDEDCVPNNDYSSSGYTCVPKYGTTVPPACGDMSWCDRSCYLDYYDTANGCPNCICEERHRPACEYYPCGPDEDCVQNDYFWDYTCVSRYETATVLPTCQPISCDVCSVEYGPDGCPSQCICGDPICMLVSCGPDEQCVPNEYNSSDYTCVSTSGVSTSVADPCPPQDPCGKRCMYGLKTDKAGCQLCECLDEPNP